MLDVLKRQQYRLIGSHSAIKICHWTKQALRGKGVCYKEKFYGISSHRCLQISPCITCPNACLHCWRDSSIINKNWPFKSIDEPDKIIDRAIAAQRQLLSGFKGLVGIDMDKWREAQKPNQVAISLVGEPTLYPKIDQLINKFKDRGFTVFLVTNGLFPEKLQMLVGDAEPTQLYISVNANTEAMYRSFCRPALNNAWTRFKKSLALMKRFSCRKVIRITVVKSLNDCQIGRYAKLIDIACPDFVEIKGYMALGSSRERLGPKFMPSFAEIENFAAKLPYRAIDQSVESRVVLLSYH
jgi:tRNA wybutosine-synthesizing protein 1